MARVQQTTRADGRQTDQRNPGYRNHRERHLPTFACNVNPMAHNEVQPVTVNPGGPVFISHRHSDAKELARAMAWAVRAAGMPAWLDTDDLPPGDVERRVGEAMAGGLSGAVVVVTPEIAASSFIRDVELPQLLRLAEDPAFTLSVVSTLTTEAGTIDAGAADDLLMSKKTLADFLQQQVESNASQPRQLAKVAHWHARRRLEAIGHLGAETVTVRLGTRDAPAAAPLTTDLGVVLREPELGRSRPSRDALTALQAAWEWFPSITRTAGTVRFSGDAHLSVACAIGASLPATRPVCVEVEAFDGTWSLAAKRTGYPVKRVAAEQSDPEQPVIVYVDLLPSSLPGAARALKEKLGPASFLHLRISTERIDPTDGGALAMSVATEIRRFVSQVGGVTVHLLLACPFASALLIGQSLNTLTLHLYEWENGTYVPSMVVKSGVGGSVIQEVTMDVDEIDWA